MPALDVTDLQAIAKIIYPAKGTVWFVSTSGNNGNSGLSWAAAKLTIQAAATASAAGDVIIAAGAFNESVLLGTDRKLILTHGSSITSTSIPLTLGDRSESEGGRIVADDSFIEAVEMGADTVIRHATLTSTSSQNGALVLGNGARARLENCSLYAADGPMADQTTDTIFFNCRLQRTGVGTNPALPASAAGFLINCDLLNPGTLANTWTVTGTRGAPVTAANQVEPFKTGARSDVVSVNGTPVDLTFGANVLVTPTMVTSTNPRYSTRDLPPIAQGSAPTEIFTLVDAAGAAIDVSGKTLRLVASTVDDNDTTDETLDDAITSAVFKYETDGDGLTIGGASNNQVTLQHSETKTATVGSYRYWLWNVNDKLVYVTGSLSIEPASFNT